MDSILILWTENYFENYANTLYLCQEWDKLDMGVLEMTNWMPPGYSPRNEHNYSKMAGKSKMSASVCFVAAILNFNSRGS